MSPQRFEGVTIEFAADYDLVSAALAMLAHGLCELPPDEREAQLEAFENGRLRSAVSRFVIYRLTQAGRAPASSLNNLN